MDGMTWITCIQQADEKRETRGAEPKKLSSVAVYLKNMADIHDKIIAWFDESFSQ